MASSSSPPPSVPTGSITGYAVGPLAGLVIILPLAFALNWLIYRVLLMPLVRRAKSRDALEADWILFTFGLLFVVQGLLLATSAVSYYSYSYLLVPVDVLGDDAPRQPAGRRSSSHWSSDLGSISR